MRVEISPEQREAVLRPHFTAWSAEYGVKPNGSGFIDEHQNPAWPAHAIMELNGDFYLIGLDGFEESGLKKDAEQNPLLKEFIRQATDIPKGSNGSLRLDIAGCPYLVRAQDTSPAQVGNGKTRSIINVLFTTAS